MSKHGFTSQGPDEKSHKFQVELGDDLDDAVEQFGAETVYLLFCQKAKDSAGREAKRLLKKVKPEEAYRKMLAWRPVSKAVKLKEAKVARANEALEALPADVLKDVLREKARSIHSQKEQ